MRTRTGTVTALMSLAGIVLASEGRDFAASYKTADVVEAGEEVSLTLKLRVYNYGADEVAGATITLEDSAQPDKICGSFADVSIPARTSVPLEAGLTVLRREYEAWQTGGTPRLYIEFQDQQGEPVRRTIEIVPALLDEEG
jgi:hypothetical protein